LTDALLGSLLIGLMFLLLALGLEVSIALGLVGLPLVPAVIAATLLVALYGQCRPRVARLDAPGVPYPAGGRRFSIDALLRNTGS